MIEYIKETELAEGFTSAVAAAEPLHKPFPEYERIARNRPHPGIAKELPKVTDGTVAAMIMKQPKRTIQQIPTGKLKSKDEWMALVGGYILENVLLDDDDYVAELIQKCWALCAKSLTYGSQPWLVQLIHDGQKYTVSFSLPYIQDVFLEQGKLSYKDSSVIYVRAWYQPSQIDAIIEGCKQRKKAAEDRGEMYEDLWDMKALEEIKDKVQEKEDASKTPAEREKGMSPTGIQLIHAFQKGVGSTFYTFYMGGGDDDSDVTVCRRKKNPDPRGLIPLGGMYADFDFSNPYGRGLVELAGPMQNLLDSEVQAYQYKRIMEMDGPVVGRGTGIQWSTIKNRPRAIWKMGPQDTVEPVKYSTTSLERFPDNYGLIKSQILNLGASPDTSIGSEVGNPGFSRTPAGVKSMEANLSIDDNYLRKQFESCWQEIMETMLNLYFAEKTGKEVLQLDKATADKVRKLRPEAVNENNEVMIDYDGELEAIKFRVDPSSSSVQDNQQQVEILGALLERIEGSPMLAELVPKEKLTEIYNSIVTASGVEDPEKLQIETEEELDENGQPVQKPQGLTPEDVQMMIQEALAGQQPQDDPLLKVFSELPESAKRQLLEKHGIQVDDDSPRQQELNVKKFQAAEKAAGPSDVEMDQQQPEEEIDNSPLIQALTERGFSPEQIQVADEMLQQEATDEEILQAIGAPQGAAV